MDTLKKKSSMSSWKQCTQNSKKRWALWVLSLIFQSILRCGWLSSIQTTSCKTLRVKFKIYYCDHIILKFKRWNYLYKMTKSKLSVDQLRSLASGINTNNTCDHSQVIWERPLIPSSLIMFKYKRMRTLTREDASRGSNA